MKEKNIPIPSDLVLKVAIYDLFDQNGDAIDITELTKAKLTFSSGGASKDFEIIFDAGQASCPDGVSVVNPDDDDPHFVVCLCTAGLMPGQLSVRSEAVIPDTRFHDGTRTEVSEYVFPIILT